MSKAAQSPVRALGGNPFPGLRPFRDDEEHLFFGREAQVDAMVDKLAAARLLAIIGSSGSGKSSLVNCGLRPALHRGLMATAGTSWRIVQFRPGDQPLGAMAKALSADGALFSQKLSEDVLQPLVEATLQMSKLGLIDLYDQAQPEKAVNLLIVVDQFEEIFRYRAAGLAPTQANADNAADLTAFINLLLEAASQTRLPIYVALTMRSDFLGDCAQFAGLPEAINRGLYLVPRLTRDERRQAIAGPIAVAGGAISPVLLTRLVNDVGENPDQLSILQHALNRTWAQWKRVGPANGSMALSHYEAIGTMANALDQHAEKVLEELTTDRQRKICETLFKALTFRGKDGRGVQQPTRFSTICALADAAPEDTQQVIDVFRKSSRSFLMPPMPEPLRNDTVVDISHESLMRVWKRLAGWVDGEAESAAKYLHLAESAARYEKRQAGLLADPELSLLLEWRERQSPNAEWAERYCAGFGQATTFLDQSRQSRDGYVRRKRLLLTVFVIVVVAVVVGIAAMREHSYASQEVKKQYQEVEKRDETMDNMISAFSDLEIAEENENLVNNKWDDKGNLTKEQRKEAKKEEEGAEHKSNDAEYAAAKEFAKDSLSIWGGTLLSIEDLKQANLFEGSTVDAAASTGAKNYTSLFDRKSPPRFDRKSPPSDSDATIFEDGQSNPFKHKVQWKTPVKVSVGSIAIFAYVGPDDDRFFRRFQMSAWNGKNWTPLVEYVPSIPYADLAKRDNKDSADNGDDNFLALAVCLPISNGPSKVQQFRAEQFKAEFDQAFDKFGPRVVGLSGFSDANCNAQSSAPPANITDKGKVPAAPAVPSKSPAPQLKSGTEAAPSPEPPAKVAVREKSPAVPAVPANSSAPLMKFGVEGLDGKLTDQEEGWFLSKNDFTTVKTSAAGTFYFDVRFPGKILKRAFWIANYKDNKNYVQFEIDDRSITRATVTNGKTVTERPIVHELAKYNDHYTLSIEVSSNGVVFRGLKNGSYVPFYTWTADGSNLLQAKFGFRDDVSLRGFRFEGAQTKGP